MDDGIVIAGGGLAAQRAAETLRRQGYDGALRMICDEPYPPYDRPPLSKEVLSGEREGESLRFRPLDWYRDRDVDLLLGVRAVELLPSQRTLRLDDCSALRFRSLLIATGGRPRRLALLDGHENVSQLRTIDDALRLRTVLSGHPRMTVIGAGFIGLEVAASARRLGAQVTLVEAAPRPLMGILGRRIGTWFAELHRAEGVEVLTSRTVARVHGDGAARRLELSDGSLIETDHVLVGIGSEPDAGWVAGSGLDPMGVRVDAHGRTGVEGVFAAGDAAATLDGRLGRHVPGSHWEAAGRQGVRAARAMLGLDPGIVELSSFWTDQYGVRIQYLGHAGLADSLSIDGEPSARDFTATYTRAGRPIGALLVNRTRALPQLRQLIDKENRDDLHRDHR